MRNERERDGWVNLIVTQVLTVGIAVCCIFLKFNNAEIYILLKFKKTEKCLSVRSEFCDRLATKFDVDETFIRRNCRYKLKIKSHRLL